MTVASQFLSLPRDGETANGDAVVVRTDGAVSLLAVVDALGHGPGAAAVADAAVKFLAAVPLSEGVLRIVERLHETLRGTRGACAMVCVYGANRIDGCGVGNVEMRAASGRLPIVLTPGVLGGQLKRPRVFGNRVEGPDRLIFFSDGISARFPVTDLRLLSPADACRAVMDRHRRPYDDATVLVADLEG